MDQSNEVQEIMSRSYGMPEVDDAELEAELSALGDDLAADTDASYLDAANAPAVPSAIPGAESSVAGPTPASSKPAAAGKVRRRLRPNRLSDSYPIVPRIPYRKTKHLLFHCEH